MEEKESGEERKRKREVENVVRPGSTRYEEGERGGRKRYVGGKKRGDRDYREGARETRKRKTTTGKL